MSKDFTSAIIVAAGSGTRFGSVVPKQFLEVAGVPLLVHTIRQFEECPAVDEIVVVVSAEGLELVRKLTADHDLNKIASVVEGASTRAGSVSNGLAAVSPETALVAVHDGARPLVTADEISATLSRAAEMGAACLVAAVSDTIKTVANGEITGTLDRGKLRRALTPQCFRIEVLRAAFDNAEISEIVTDECYLVEKLGHPIAVVEGSSRNIKVTTPEDLAFVEAILCTE